MSKPHRHNPRLGRPPIYDFGTIRAGGKKFISYAAVPDDSEKNTDADKLKRVRDAALAYAKRKKIRLKTEPTDDGKGIDVRRLNRLKK